MVLNKRELDETSNNINAEDNDPNLSLHMSRNDVEKRFFKSQLTYL